MQTEFTELIFESEILTALRLLLTALQRGRFDDAVDCITAWQDLTDSNDSPLCPLLECLQDEDQSIVTEAIRVISGLVLHAPDSVREFRIKNELAGK
uniref:HEAT repeat domain-containing protein n=1 Tax=Heterorhabditis bacteriophora TaxID=37862 RepID=A0A1I7XJQ4_HETBA